MSLTTLTLFLAFLLTSGVDHNFRIEEASESVIAFLELLNLTQSTCESIHWCTIRDNNYNLENYVRRVCCPRCSCDEWCFQEDNCCPDIKLSKYLNGTVFTNAQDLVSTLYKIDGVSELDIAYNHDVEARGDLKTECVTSALHGPSLKSQKPSMYLMVTTCQNQSLSDEQKSKCEQKHEVTPQTQLVEIRPVQSLDTGIVYRNIYCFYCSNENKVEYVEWDVYISELFLNYGNFKNLHLTYSDIITSAIQTSFLGLKNVIFKPSRKLKQTHPPTTCATLDVNSCSNNDTDVIASIENACQLFYSPVLVPYQNKKTMFQNLACVHCNETDTTARVCQAYVLAHSPLLWKLKSEFLTEKNNETSSNSSNIASISSPQCTSGFVYDKVKVSALRRLNARMRCMPTCM